MTERPAAAGALGGGRLAADLRLAAAAPGGQPAASVILGEVLLSEAPSAMQLLRAVVVLGGVGVATVAPRRAPVPA